MAFLTDISMKKNEVFKIPKLLLSLMRVISGCARVVVSDVHPNDGTITGHTF